VIGILSTVEYMLSINTFKPRRTVILAFGQDEEADGIYGAVYISKLLEKRHGKHGIGIIVDEGGSGLEERYGVKMALPAVAEKGECDNFEPGVLFRHSVLLPLNTFLPLYKATQTSRSSFILQADTLPYQARTPALGTSRA
jgi:hypothetical protein